MMVGDVTVVGLDTEMVVFADVGMSVGHRQVVVVPADKATLSKDLWRAISQRRVFQLHAGVVSTNPTRPLVPPMPIDHLYDRIQHLERENAALRQELSAFRSSTPAVAVTAPQPEVVASVSDPRLDEILTLLKSGVQPISTVHTVQTPKASTSDVRTVVEIDVPAFIPQEIRPANVEGRITEATVQTREAGNLGSAADALRKMRQNQ